MRDAYRKHRGVSVVVQTDDATFIGELADSKPSVITLANAVIAEPTGRTPMDGRVLVPVDRIAWVQVS